MIKLLKNLQPLFYAKHNFEEDEANKSDYESESASSDADYADCESDDQPQQVSSQAATATSFVYPPLSSIQTEALHSDCESNKEPKQVSSQAATSSVYLPLSSIHTEAILSSDSKEGHFIELHHTDDFDQTNTTLKSADLRKISTPSRGSTIYKNQLQTLCQQSRIKFPTYFHVKEGLAHAPIFTAAVEVWGKRFESEGQHRTKIEAEQDAASVALSHLCPGARSVLVNKVKPKGQLSTCEGLTAETPIDLTIDEESSPPLSALLTARKSEFQKVERAEVSISLSETKKPISSGRAAPARLDNDVQDIAGQFSELQLTRSVPVSKFVKRAWEPQSVKWPSQTEHLKALGELDFSTHAFPLLAKLNGLPLEKAFSVDEIKDLQNMPADEVDAYLWSVDVRYNRSSTVLPPPRVQIDPELLLYDCIINPKGELRFKTSVNRQGSTLLQRTLGFDKVLRVSFTGEIQVKCYKRILTDGIFVGERFYQYFVHKPSDGILTDEEKRSADGTVKCYFVCTDSRANTDVEDGFKIFSTIAQARYKFIHVQNCPTVAKYIARLQLCLSKTMTINDISFSDLVITELEDLPSKDSKNAGALFTDGTGFISTDLARIMPTNIFKGMKLEDGQGFDLREDYPSLIQVRFFHEGAAHKGTLLANDKLCANTIQYYKSMKKVQCDPSISRFSISSFELVSSSRHPRCAKLSQDLIVLLSIGGVKESVFLDALKYATDQVLMILRDRRQAHREVLQWEWESDLVETTLQMIAAGMPLEEPGLQKNLLTLIKNKLNDFAKGRVPLAGSFYLMGTADPSGTLKPNEVAIYLNNGLVYGKVLLYRAPGKHPGDPHEAQAVHSQAIEDIVGGCKNVIFFSTQGTRPLPHKIAKGDLDGDLYWVCTNKKVVEQFRSWPSRWNQGHVNSKPGKGLESPKELSPADLEDALVDEFLNERFHKSSVVGKASFRWLRHVDAYLHLETSSKDKETHMTEMLKLPDYIYEGVDMKSGVQLVLPPEHDILKKHPVPPYLWKRKHLESYVSRDEKSILGKIYEQGVLAQGKTKGPSYGREDFQPDPAFHVEDSENHLDFWTKKYNRYRVDMARALKDADSEDSDEPNRINMIYKMILYGAPSFKERKKERQRVFEEASAIYQIVYDHAGKNADWGKAPSISFAWNVAGAALATIYAENQPGGNSIVWSSVHYKEVHKKQKATVPAHRKLF